MSGIAFLTQLAPPPAFGSTTAYSIHQGSTIHTRSHMPLASKETFFTRQQKYVTCQINKDTNSYYITSICIYLYIIMNPVNETEHA